MKKIILFSLIFVFVSLTRVFAETPTTPEILSLVPTSSTITITFAANDDEITDGYYIYYWATDDSEAVTTVKFPNPATVSTSYSFTIKGLENNTEYTVKISAYDGTDESASSSDKVETSSVTIRVQMIAPGTAEVTLEEIPSGVDSYDVYFGINPVPAEEDYVLAVDSDTAFTLSGLENGSYHVLVRLNDSQGNVIAESDSVTFVVENFETFFSSAGDIEDGCFVNSTVTTTPPPYTAFCLVIMLISTCFFISIPYKRLAIGLLAVLFLSSVAQAEEDEFQYNNIIGIKAALFDPAEDLQDDVYESIVPVSLYYERMLGSCFSADISAGYAQPDGYAVTTSSTETGVETELDLIPIAVSLNVNKEIYPLITVFAGAGVDYWFFNEKSYYGERDSNVAGWHGKAGLKLLTADSSFYKKAGILLEVSYTAIDRFGRNDVDLGGWSYGGGIMYCF